MTLIYSFLALPITFMAIALFDIKGWWQWIIGDKLLASNSVTWLHLGCITMFAWIAVTVPFLLPSNWSIASLFLFFGVFLWLVLTGFRRSPKWVYYNLEFTIERTMYGRVDLHLNRRRISRNLSVKGKNGFYEGLKELLTPKLISVLLISGVTEITIASLWLYKENRRTKLQCVLVNAFPNAEIKQVLRPMGIKESIVIRFFKLVGSSERKQDVGTRWRFINMCFSFATIDKGAWYSRPIMPGYTIYLNTSKSS